MHRPHSRAKAPGLRHAAGLTLIEVSVSVAILALLLALAAPSFQSLLNRWRVQQAVGALTSTVQLARSEAIRRGGNVVIQKAAVNTDGCTLAAAAADWGCGWVVLVDNDANGRFTAGDEILQSVRLSPGIQLKHVKGKARIRIDRWGQMDGLDIKHFVIFPAAAGEVSAATRSICITSGGRIRNVEGPSC